MPDTEYIPTWHPLFIPRPDSDPPTGMPMSTTPSPHYPRDQRNTAARREQTTGSPQGAVSRNAKCRKAYRNKKCREAYRNKMSKGIPKLRPNVERHPPYTLATYQVNSLGGKPCQKSQETESKHPDTNPHPTSRKNSLIANIFQRARPRSSARGSRNSTRPDRSDPPPPAIKAP